MPTYTIAVLPGDGIGQEVTPEAVRVLRAVGTRTGVTFEFEQALIGGSAIDATDRPLPPETLALCRRADAILFGAVGGPKWDSLPQEQRAERGLLALRKVADAGRQTDRRRAQSALLDLRARRGRGHRSDGHPGAHGRPLFRRAARP